MHTNTHEYEYMSAATVIFRPRTHASGARKADVPPRSEASICERASAQLSAKVTYLGLAVSRQQHVGGLEVAVDDDRLHLAGSACCARVRMRVYAVVVVAAWEQVGLDSNLESGV